MRISYWSSDVCLSDLIDFDDVTLKNIFGYRKNRIHVASDTDGTELVLIDALRVLRSDDQFTDELQLSGALFDGSLEWLAGGFYLKNKPKGPNSISYYLYQPSAEDAAANTALDFVSTFLRQNSEAVIQEDERKCVVSGKGVSGVGDFGGRRISKK